MNTFPEQQDATNWQARLHAVFQVLDDRRAAALEQRPVDEEEFRWFVQTIGIPAFRRFRDALTENGDEPEYNEGDDWVAVRWPDGHAVGISPLLRAPSRATAAMHIARTHRRLHGQEDLGSITDVMQDDVLLWLVRHYANWKRVAEVELDGQAADIDSDYCLAAGRSN